MTNFKFIQLTFALAIIVMLFFQVPFIWYGLLFFSFLFIILIGSFTISWNFHLKAFTSQTSNSDKRIAITFDDGPNSEFTPNVLELLSKYNAKATFFSIGMHIEAHPEILKSIADAGHEVGNHSYSHNTTIDFNKTNEWLKEIETTDALIEKVTGKQSTLFRPPFGVTTPNLAKALKTTNHKVIGWNIRSFDTVISNPEVIQKRIRNRVKPGAIVLLHDTHKNSQIILEHLLQFLQQNGYKMVTINELMNEH